MITQRITNGKIVLMDGSQRLFQFAEMNILERDMPKATTLKAFRSEMKAKGVSDLKEIDKAYQDLKKK